MESTTLIHARLTAPRNGIAPDLAIQSSADGWSCSWAGGRLNARKPADLAERNGVRGALIADAAEAYLGVLSSRRAVQ